MLSPRTEHAELSLTLPAFAVVLYPIRWRRSLVCRRRSGNCAAARGRTPLGGRLERVVVPLLEFRQDRPTLRDQVPWPTGPPPLQPRSATAQAPHLDPFALRPHRSRHDPERLVLIVAWVSSGLSLYDRRRLRDVHRGLAWPQYDSETQVDCRRPESSLPSQLVVA